MVTKEELVQAIEECERGTASYATCQKLATFYTVYDHLFDAPKIAVSAKNMVTTKGESDFLRAIGHIDEEKAWEIMDELMETLKIINPRLYEGVMRRVAV